MPDEQPTDSQPPAAAVPKTFFEYLRSFGPGLVVVLTWLGAGDVVDMGVAGGNYGYSLMWALVLAVVMRFLFVSLIAKYQLCNPRGEGVLDGLVRLHPWYAPAILLAAIVMGHFYGSYMTRGIGEVCRNVIGFGPIWLWALVWNGIALALVFQPAYGRVEALFKVFLAVLTVSFVGTAVWIGPDVSKFVHGLYTIEIPKQEGAFAPMLVVLAMIGAVGGSLMNLVYPYFLEAKGWRGPEYRRVQLYDFLLAIAVMIVVDLAIWMLGAELLHPEGLSIKDMDDLPRLLSTTALGAGGRLLFYAGIFAAVFTSLVGHAIGLAYLGTHALSCWQNAAGSLPPDYRRHPCYRGIVVWVLVSPLVWTLPGMPDFVTLTLVVNAGQVVLLPFIAGGLWWITASERFIGPQYRNRWWENSVMALLFALAIYSAWQNLAEFFAGGG